ncbi:MAG: undecaprenyl-phosphate glucose phosphotransferase [Sterolibacteriaceae bacterium]|nr:undecaprenyl-phosphate glucose phosphotransferase [Candidatus Methylophosphatis haderslevensis]
MDAVLNRQHPFLKSRLSLTRLVISFLDPLALIASLLAIGWYFEEAIGAPYIILALIVFSLDFPGRSYMTARFGVMLRDVLLGWLLLAFILLFFGYASGYLKVFPPEVLRNWAILAPVAQICCHVLLRTIVPRVVSMGANVRRSVIVGANDLGLQLSREISESPYLGTRFLGFFDDRSRNRLGNIGEVTLLGPMCDVATFVRDQGIDLIYLSLPMTTQPRILNLLDDLADTTASVYFVPDIFVTDLIQARMDDINGMPVVAVCDTPFSGMNGLIKRTSDIVLALLILVLVSPFMLAIAIGVRLSSPGPILFRQRRYGLDGKEIMVYKFRSMSVMEDGRDIIQATRNDARITPLGSLLRRTSLDELPQFINVLQGRMSIVGPRPHAVAHNEMYRKLIRGYMVRHKVKPGITGWAQVNGLRGETRTLDKMKRRIDYDLEYLRNWSLKLDLMIIMRTILIVLKDRNAY